MRSRLAYGRRVLGRKERDGQGGGSLEIQSGSAQAEMSERGFWLSLNCGHEVKRILLDVFGSSRLFSLGEDEGRRIEQPSRGRFTKARITAATASPTLSSIA